MRSSSSTFFFEWKGVCMNEVPQIPEQLTFKLLFGLFEGSATGSLAISCLFVLGMLILIGKAVTAAANMHRTRTNSPTKKRK